MIPFIAIFNIGLVIIMIVALGSMVLTESIKNFEKLEVQAKSVCAENYTIYCENDCHFKCHPFEVIP